MRWWYVYLLGTVTLLTIALRRVVRRQRPLDDELYSKRVAIDHVHSGVAWVRADGGLGSVNPALATALGTTPEILLGQEWVETIFPKPEWSRIREAYSQMLIKGKESLSLYTFNTGTAKHYFCKNCGVKSFYVPRSHPDGYSVNARCIDSPTITGMKISYVDGRNWEKHYPEGRGEYV